MYSVKEVAEILGKLRGGSPLKRTAIYNYIAQKKLKTGLEGREHVISESDLKEFVEQYFVHHKDVKRKTVEEMGYSMPFLTVEEVAEKLAKLRGLPDFNTLKVYNYIKTKRLKATKTHSRISIVTEADFREFIEQDYLLVHRLEEDELKKLGIRQTYFSMREMTKKLRKMCNNPCPSSINPDNVYALARRDKLNMIKNKRGHFIVKESDMNEFIEKDYLLVHKLDESELEKLGIRKTHFSLGEIAIKIREICNVPSIIEYDVYFIAQKLNLTMSKNQRGHIRITESEIEEFIEQIIQELKQHNFQNIYNPN